MYKIPKPLVQGGFSKRFATNRDLLDQPFCKTFPRIGAIAFAILAKPLSVG